jgi:membrane protein implicated in regulation of membrane protease activity
MSMGRFFDFAKRRIVGYIVFWILVLLFLGVFYQGNPPAQAGGLFILGVAFIASLLYTRRMKRRQRARREAEQHAKQMQQAYQMQQMALVQAPPMGQAQQAQRLQPPPRAGGR